MKRNDKVRINDEGYDTMSDAREAVRISRLPYVTVDSNIEGFVSLKETPYLFVEEHLTLI